MPFPTIPTAGNGRLLTGTQANETATRTFPAFSGLTYNDGDLLIAVIIAYRATGTSNATFSGWSNGFTEQLDAGTVNATDANATMAIGVATKIASGTESGSLTVTQAATVDGDVGFFLMAIPGAHATTVPEFITAFGSAAIADPAALNPANWDVEDTLWIAVGGSGEISTTGSYTAMGAGTLTNYGDIVTLTPTGDAQGKIGGAIGFRQNATASEDVTTWATPDTSNARNCALVIAVRPAVPKQTSTAEISLASANTPDTRTAHAIKARARKQANQGTLRVRLYEGANTRSAELESSELTTSLAEYTFNIANADAETITSYSDLSIRFYGYSGSGAATVFEVAELWLSIPEAGVTSVSKDLTASYNVVGNVTKALSASYNVQVELTKALTASHNIQVEISKALTANYNVIQQITKTVTASYSIAGAVTQAVTANYNVQVIVSKAVTASYNVIAQVSKSVTASYGIAGIVTKEITASYNVIQQITQAVTATYTIATELAKALSASYSIVGSVTKTLTASYNIVGLTQTAHARVSLANCNTPQVDTGHSFNIRARITNAAHTGAIRMQLWEGANPITGVYQPTALSTTMTTYNMEITEGQAANIVDYDNLEIEFWGISDTGTPTVFEVAEFWLEIPEGLASVSKSLTANYQIQLQSVSKSLTANYGIGGVLQKSLTATPKVHRFGPRGLHNLLVSTDTLAVTKSLTASYSVAGSLQKSLSASYNVQVSVSKTLTANYNVSVELVKILTANYNVIAQVSKTLTANYNVTTAVSKTLTASYNVPGAIQKALSASYNVRVELSKSLAANYNVLSTASVLKSLTASYNVAAQLQKALSASYFVTTIVSKTLSPSYNLIAQVSKTLTANYSIISFTAVSKTLSANYNVQVLVGQSLTTFYTLQGGVSKTLTSNYNVRVILTKNLSASYTVNGGVAKTLTANYNVIAQVQKSVTAIYALGFVVVKPLTSNYTVREQITKTLSPNYIVIGQITKELIPTYVTKVILTKDLVANYWKEDPLTPPPPYEPVGSVNLEGSPQGVNLTTASKPRGRIVRVP